MQAVELEGRLRARQRIDHDGVIEETRLIDAGGVDLFSVIVRPGDGAPARSTALVICHSYFEMKPFARVELTLLRRAAALGFTGVYVQAPGAGDSGGSLEECTIEGRVDAARRAAAVVRDAGATRVCFVGARLGASVALLAAGAGDAVALWDPALVGEDYWRQTRRFARMTAAMARTKVADADDRLDRDPVVTVVEHAVTRALRDDLASIDRVRQRDPLDGPGLVVALSDTLLRSARQSLRTVVADLDGVSLDVPRLRQLVHLRIGEAGDAVAATLAWLERRLP